MARSVLGERGQVLPLLVVVVLGAGMAMVTLGHLGRAALQRAGARTAADAAALAGAADGEEAARAVARANGGTLLRYVEDGAEVEVRVRVGRAEAPARARRAGLGVGAGGAGAASADVAPALRAALATAERLLGRPIPVTSGRRSRAEQAALWARRATNPFPVARPGSSRHELGLAVDVARAFVPELLRVAGRAGLCQPYPERDPVHFELCR